MIGVEEERKWKHEEDVEELRGVLSVVSEFLEQLPAILDKVISSLTSKEMGERLGESVASFYKKLKESGIPEEQAREMAREFFDKSMVLDRILTTALEGMRGRKFKMRKIVKEAKKEAEEEEKEEEEVE